MAGRNLERRIHDREHDSVKRIETRLLTKEEIREILKEAGEKYPAREITSTGVEEGESHIERSVYSQPTILDTHKKFEFILRGVSPEIRLKRGYEKGLRDARRYYKNNMEGKPPSLVMEMEERLVRFLYEETHGGPPEIQIDSTEDIDRLLKRYPKESEEEEFPSRYRKSKIYFEVRKDTFNSQKELARIHDILRARISDYKAGKETTLIARLRRYENKRIINEWKQRTQGKLNDDEKLAILERYLSNDSDDAFDLKANSNRGIYRVEQSVLSQCERIGMASVALQEISSIVFSMYQEVHKTESKIAYLENIGIGSFLKELSESERKSIEDGIKKKLNLDDNDKGVRISLVDNRLYLWILRTSPNDMINLWSEQFFHFKTKVLSSIILEVGEQLQLHKNGYEQLRHFNKLAGQITSKNLSGRIKVGRKTSRVMGETLHLACDILGTSPKSLEAEIESVTGRNGRGGILHPKLLDEKELEILRARLAAVVNSDCWLGADGRLQYTEADRNRIRTVASLFGSFGEMSLKPVPNEENRSLKMWIPRPMGNSFIYWGFTAGEKPILNEQIPALIREGSLECYKAYFEELISEDGCFDVVSGFRWSRTIVLNLGTIDVHYSRKPELSQEEVSFLLKFKYARRDTKEHVYVPIGKLKNYSKLLVGQELNIARRILSIVEKNRSKLLDDEVHLATKLGIVIVTYPEYITLYPDTNRVSLKWVAKTKNKDDAIRWALIAPPNDQRKNRRVQKWLAKIPDDVERVQSILRSEGMNEFT